MRKIKNEFMSMWDGLRTKQTERVLVLAATNRPFDLDEAVLRRLNRRLLVDLPSGENRAKILRVVVSRKIHQHLFHKILHDEELASDVNIDSLATLTEGFSGSDLKNLCVMAAYQPIREFISQEKAKKQVFSGIVCVSYSLKSAEAGGAASSSTPASQPNTEVLGNAPSLRPLSMADFEKTLKEVAGTSVNEDAFSLAELRKWNDMYGDSGSRRKQPMSYFM